MLNYEQLPESLRGGMKRYFEHGIEPGSFLMAVLENNLMEAFLCADEGNRARMLEIAYWLYNEVPIGTFKSPEKCRAYMRRVREQREVANA